MKDKSIFYDGKKAVSLWGDDLTGWNVFAGEELYRGEVDSYRFVPTMFRAVQLRANSVASMPFQLMSGDEVYDDSLHWENKVGFMPNPHILLKLVESALIIAGSCYLFRERSIAGTKALRYHLPRSVKPQINQETGKLEYF